MHNPFFRLFFGNIVGKIIVVLAIGILASWIIDTYVHSSLTQADSSGDGVAFVVLLLSIALGVAFSLAIYFIPTIVANNKAHPDKAAIFVLNLLLGWLFIPWVIALVWAYKEKAVVTVESVGSRDFSSNSIETSLGREAEYRKCPFCAEYVKREAIKCKHCGSEIEPLPIDQC